MHPESAVNRNVTLTLTALAALTVAAPGALAAPKPITKTYTATAPAPDPTNYAADTYTVCAQNVPGSFHTTQFKAPSAGTLRVVLSKFTGDWDSLLLDAEGNELGAGSSSDLSVPEVMQVKLKKPQTVKIVACNWAGSATAQVTYTFSGKK